MSAEKDTYVRRRAFNKIHVTSWLIYLEKDGFVRCPFKNCNFMAFDVNEMCEHYGFCKGDCSFAKYVCEVCKGCTVSEKRLQEHRSRAHNIEILPQETDNTPEEYTEPGKPNRVQMLTWGFFFEKHNYIKCCNCHYLANTMSEMCRHHLVCKQERKFLLYVCPECKGRTHDVAPLITHLERAHKISKRADQFNHISRNMLQFWEKELRDGKYATCLHINSNKERDCLYIDVDILGINEHSQTCKGPEHVTASSQSFCKYCSKWTSSQEKLTKHIQLSHLEICNSLVNIEENDKLTYSVATVKGELLNNSQVAKRFGPANKLRTYQSNMSHSNEVSTIKQSLVSIKPFETVFIKGEYGLKPPHEIHNSVEKNNSINGAQKNHIKKETSTITVTQNNVSSYSSKQTCSSETDTHNSLPNHGQVETSKLVGNSNVDQRLKPEVDVIVVEEHSFPTICHKDQENQEIYLDLVEDKLVARKSIDGAAENKYLEKNTPKEVHLNLHNSPFIKHPEMTNQQVYEQCSYTSANKKLDENSQNAVIIDLVKDEFTASQNGCMIADKNEPTEMKLEVDKLEAEINSKQMHNTNPPLLFEVESSMSSKCINETNSIKLQKNCSKKALPKERSSVIVLDASQELFKDEIEIIEIEDENSSELRVQAKNVCMKAENDKSENGDDGISKSIKESCYVLFKDELSSDEEDCVDENIEKVSGKEDNVKVSDDWESEKKTINNSSPKNYTRRRSSDDKLERCSPTKCQNSSSKQNGHEETGQCKGLEDVERTTISTYKGKKTWENQYKTQFQAKNNFIFQNRISNIGELQEEASKNSEKNDKLMVIDVSCALKNEEPSDLCDQNETTLQTINQSFSENKKSHTIDEDVGSVDDKTDNVLESEQKSLDRITCNPIQSFSKEIIELKSPEKTLHSKMNSVTSNEILSRVQLNVDCKEGRKTMSSNSITNVYESSEGNINKGNGCIDLTGDDSQEYLKTLEGFNQSSSFNSNCVKRTPGIKEVGYEEDTNSQSGSKVVSFFYSGKLNKPIVVDSLSNKKSTEDVEHTRSKEYSINKLKCWSNESSLSKACYESVKNNDGKNSSYPNGNESEMNTDHVQQIQLNNNSTDSRSTLDIVSRIQSDFLDDTSSDEEAFENKITAESDKSSNEINTDIKAEPLGKSLTDLGKKLKVRRISSDFFDDSSLNEEDFLGTDEELDMKDNFFNGFQEISENNQIKNRRFRQFLNRISESENEEWYVNAGNLSMDVRKDSSLCSKSLNLKSNMEYNSLRSNGEKTTVIIVDEDSNKEDNSVKPLKEYNDSSREINKVKATYCNSNFQVSEESGKQTHDEINNTYSHGKATSGAKLNKKYDQLEIGMKKKIDQVDNLSSKERLFVSSSKDSSVKFSSLETNPTKSLKISLSFEKLDVFSKNIIETNCLQRTEEDMLKKTIELSKVNTNNNSNKLIENILEKKELTSVVEEEAIVIEDSPETDSCNNKEKEVGKRYNSEDELKHKSGNTANSHSLQCHLKSKNNHKSDGMVTCNNSVIDLIENTPRKRNPSHEEINADNQYCEMKKNYLKENKLILGTAATISEPDSHKVNTGGGTSKDIKSKKLDINPFLGSRLQPNKLMPRPEFTDELLTSVTDDIPRLIVSSTPEKGKQETQSGTPAGQNSSPWKDDSEQNFKSCDDSTDSDDEPLSVIQKSCSLSGSPALFSMKETVVTEGFSPHNNNTHENNLEGDKVDERKIAHCDTAADLTETDAIGRNKVNSNVSENIKTVNIHESKILTKKRGRKSKGDQDEGKSKKMPEISGKDGMVKTRKGHKGNFEESSTSISISDIAIYNCSESEELRINSPALDNFAKLEKIEFQESPSQPKRRGRPPKRKINEMNSMASKEVNRKINQINSVVSKEVDGNTLYDPIYGDELLLSIYSEEVESILVGGLKGSGDCKSQSKAVFSEPPSNNESKQVVNTDSSGVSPQTQHCPQKNTLPGEAVVPKKRGRKPKLKLESSSLVLQPETANSVRSGEVLKDIETKENDLVKDSLVENPCDSVITVPKKRGRKPKLKSQIFHPIVTSETDKSIITHDLLGKETESEKSNCNSSEVKVPKKRGRKPKLKLDISSTEHKESDRDESSVTSDKQISLSGNVPDQPENSNLCDLSVGVIKADSNGEEKVIISKKRGRKPGNQIKYDLSMNQKSANLEIEATNILEKRGRRYCRNSTLNIKEEKSGTDNNKNISTTRRKSAKLNSDINDTGSEASSVLEFCVKDRDCNSSVTSELLGTDVIFINEEKLNSSHPSTKRGRKRKKLEVVEDDSHDFEPDKYSSGNDSDDSNSKEQSVKPKKRRKVDTDDDYSNEGEETDKKDKRKMGSRSSATKKTSVNSNERIFFRTKHRSSDKVVCGTCKEEMSFTNYRKHHSIFKHYMLSWLEGEENPLDLNDEKDVVNRLWFAKKRIGKTPFRCFVCNIPKLSAVGFYSHIRFCGKDSEEKESMLVTCEVCGARLMPSSFKPHMYIKHNSRPSASGSNLEQMDSSLIVKGRRAAATRAVEVIQQRLIDDQELEGPNSRPSSPERKPHLNHLYLKPTKNVPPQEYQRWKDSLTETMVVKCTMPGCDFSANTTIHFRKHYLTCPFSPPRPYKCRVCTFTSLTLDPMVEHVEENHVDKTFSQPYGSENESSDESDGEHRHSKAVYYGTNLPFKFLKLVKMQNPRAKWPNRKRFFTAALDWTLKLRQSIFATETLYPSAQPCADDWKTAEMASSHLPELTQSIRFQGKDGTWRSLQRFHGTVVDDVPVLFAGGPVWATAWAPVPYPEEHQYLAVAPHTSVELTHKMASVYNYPGLIQVWTLGSLNNTDDGGACSPSLVFGLAHQRGPVWDLAWCPAGACSQERLGLLAAAFGDGSVVVYAVPRITQAADEPLSCCFSVEPVLELKLGCEMMSQCTCIDWHAAAPHSMIVGGFANGMVALWNLTTTSPLLKNGNTILPFKVIEAHLSAVTAVRLSWAKEDVHLMTASLDRATKFWRLNDTTSPVNALRKASVTDAVMPNNWLLSISAYDDVYSINSSHITGCSYRETFSTTNNNYILQPGTVWSLSFNDWLNGCACASEMGKVNAFFRQQLLVTEDSKKVNKSAFMEELVSCSALSIRDGSTVTSGFGPLYNDCASNVGLAFNFGGNVKGGKPASACSSDNMDSFPVRSFNTVSWNPNLSSFTWLAAGMQNGLVVVPKIKSVHADDLADLYNKHKDNL